MSSVFGAPITDKYLKGLPEFNDKTPTQKDRARVALEMKNAEGKDVNARAFGEILQQRFDGGNCSVIVMLYNATGTPLTYTYLYSWYGRVGDSPIPIRIENGQWGVFVHGGSTIARAALFYTGSDPNNEYYDWILCWSTSTNGPTNQASAGVGKCGEYRDKWDELDTKLSANPYHGFEDREGLRLLASIGNSAISSMEAICTFSDVWYS